MSDENVSEQTYDVELARIAVGPATDPRNVVTCGTCDRSWDDSVVTGITPAPAARCPFEYDHDEEPKS